ncbi:dockerin type I domain-containing protein [Ruminococcus sp.]|uniref:dockerin type I domain-containing protein n=1 Tax=Ruminococcus sp. TaxID=41978 RepID=UPI0025EE244B|nr:dockerin type I domain-containing protein [Ruminococcus sp.]
MKTFTKLVAAVLTASLAVCSTAPVNAADTDVNYDILIPIEDTPFALSFNSDEEMLKYIRTQMKKKNENIKVIRSGASDDEMSDYSSMTLSGVFKPTGDPTEGCFLRLGVYGLSSWVHSTDGGLMIEISAKYMTTAEQDEKFESQVQKLAKGVPLVMGADYMELPDSEKISTVYEYFLKLMKSFSYSENKDDNELSSAYSALIKGEANEIGFLQLFVRALAEMGIYAEPYCTNLDSTLTNAHYLAAVPLDDTYYLCDPVWDYLSGSDSGKYKFLLKGMNDIDSDIGSSAEYKHIHADILGITAQQIAETNGFSLYSYDKKFEFGDVSGDGLIDSVDASAILAEYARLSSSDKFGIFSAGQKTAADIDKNGHIDSVDTSTILSYYAYKSTSSDNTTLSEFISKK